MPLKRRIEKHGEIIRELTLDQTSNLALATDDIGKRADEITVQFRKDYGIEKRDWKTLKMRLETFKETMERMRKEHEKILTKMGGQWCDEINSGLILAYGALHINPKTAIIQQIKIPNKNEVNFRINIGKVGEAERDMIINLEFKKIKGKWTYNKFAPKIVK